MSVASVESIPDRFNALYDYEVLHMPKTQIAKRYGVCTSTVDGWVQRRNYFLNRVKDIIKIVDSGKFNYFFPGDKMETEKESEKELQRKIKYWNWEWFKAVQPEENAGIMQPWKVWMGLLRLNVFTIDSENQSSRIDRYSYKNMSKYA